MLLKTFVMGGPLLHYFWALYSNFRVKRGVGVLRNVKFYNIYVYLNVISQF